MRCSFSTNYAGFCSAVKTHTCRHTHKYTYAHTHTHTHMCTHNIGYVIYGYMLFYTFIYKLVTTVTTKCFVLSSKLYYFSKCITVCIKTEAPTYAYNIHAL